MGYIPSAETIYAVAYLTETGRNYLFNKTNNRFDGNGDDLFEITKFTLSDADANYRVNQSDGSPYKLESGEVPDIAGSRGGDCLKTTANYIQGNLIAYIFDDTPTNVEYSTDLPDTTKTEQIPGGNLLITETQLPGTTETPPPFSTAQQTGGGGFQFPGAFQGAFQQ